MRTKIQRLIVSVAATLALAVFTVGTSTAARALDSAHQPSIQPSLKSSLKPSIDAQLASVATQPRSILNPTGLDDPAYPGGALASAGQSKAQMLVTSDDVLTSDAGLLPLWLLGCAVLGFSVVARRRLSDGDP